MPNTPGEIIRYFGSNTSKPLTFREAARFWNTLTDEERWYFKYVNLQTGKLPLEVTPVHRVAPVFIEKTCSVCSKVVWDSKTGGYGEVHPDPESDGVGYVRCDYDGVQYWQFIDSSLEIHDKDGIWTKEVQ